MCKSTFFPQAKGKTQIKSMHWLKKSTFYLFSTFHYTYKIKNDKTFLKQVSKHLSLSLLLCIAFHKLLCIQTLRPSI